MKDHHIIRHGMALAEAIYEGRPLSDSKYHRTFNFMGESC